MIKILCLVIPLPMKKLEKSKNVNQLILMNVQDIVFDIPLSTQGI